MPPAAPRALLLWLAAALLVRTQAHPGKDGYIPAPIRISGTVAERRKFSGQYEYVGHDLITGWPSWKRTETETTDAEETTAEETTTDTTALCLRRDVSQRNWVVVNTCSPTPLPSLILMRSSADAAKAMPPSAGTWSVLSNPAIATSELQTKEPEEIAVHWKMPSLVTPVDETVGFVLLTGFASAGAMAVLVGSFDPHIRSMTYWLFSALLTTSVAWLIIHETDDVLKNILDNAYQQNETSGNIALVFWFVFFSGCYALLSVIAWKVQASTKWLIGVRTLGSYTVGLLGVCAFSRLQRRAVEKCWGDFYQDNHPGYFIDTREKAEVFVAFTFVIFAWLVLTVYRWASVYFRGENLRSSPVFAWSQKADTMLDRTCYPWLTSGPNMANPAGVSGAPQPMWELDVIDAEDEVASIVIGFLINQVLLLHKVNLMPAEFDTHQVTPWRTMDDIKFMYGWLFLFCVAAVSITVVRVALPRVAGRLGWWQRVATLAAAWCIYRLVRWNLKRYVRGSANVAHYGAMMAMFLVGLFLVWLADKIFDCVSHSGHLGAHLENLVLGDASVSLQERLKRRVSTTIGFLVGVALGEVTLANVTTLAETPGDWRYDATFGEVATVMADHQPLIRVLLVVTFVVLAMYSWVTSVLPMSLLPEAVHEAQIRHEMEVLNPHM